MPARVKKKPSDRIAFLSMRERQSAAAAIIAKKFGWFAESQPKLWSQRTFLLIVAKAYEYLVLCEKISPRELVELTRTLVEYNKVDAGKNRNPPHKPNGGSVVDELEEIVRRIYGANLQCGDSGGPTNRPS